MAKVKTTEIDDQLSVILNQTKESGEFVKEANRTIELFKRQIAHFSAETVNMHESKAKELNGLIEANLRLFGGEIKRTAETLKEATATIVQTKNQAIEEIKKVAENKMTYSKFTVWIASIAAIVMVIGPTSNTVVTLSRNADNTAVKIINKTKIFHGSP